MTITVKNWSLSSYTVATLTDFLADGSGGTGGTVLSTIQITNTTSAAINVSVNLATSTGTALATLLPTSSIPAGQSSVLDARDIVLVSGQKVQINAAATGLHFDADGYQDSLVLANWNLTSYTAATATDFVTDTSSGGAGTLLSSLLIINPTSGAINVSMNRTDSAGTVLATILPTQSIAANTVSRIGVPSKNLTGGQKFQINAAATGLHFYAGGSQP